MNARISTLIPAAAVLPLLLIAVAWVFGAFGSVTVDGITAYPVLRAGAAALFGASVLALVLVWWLDEGATVLPRGFITAFLLALVAAMAVERLYTLEEAFERDLMAYMMVADGILDGRPLYTEMWDHKPPGTYWTYAVFAGLFGTTPLAIWAMGLVAAALTLWGCYRAGVLLSGPKAGLIAAAIWALMSGDVMLQANQPNVEVFMNAALVWAFVWMLRAQGGLTGASIYAVIGALFFVATLYKHYVAIAAVLMVGLHLLDMVRQGVFNWGDAFKKGAVATGVVLGGWALVVAFFWMTGSLDAAYDILVGYNLEYAGSLIDNLLAALDPYAHPATVLAPYMGLFLVAAAGFLAFSFGPSSSLRSGMRLGFVYLVSTLLVTIITGRFFEHYYQLLLPPMAIAGALLFATAQRQSVFPAILVGIVLVPIVLARAVQFEIPLAQLPLVKYARYGNEAMQFVETQRMAPFINKTFAEDAIVYHLGFEPSVYFWTGRKAPTGFVLSYPFYIGSVRSPGYIDRELAALKEIRPALIVAKKMFFRSTDNAIEAWIAQNYYMIEGPQGVRDYLFLVPKVRKP